MYITNKNQRQKIFKLLVRAYLIVLFVLMVIIGTGCQVSPNTATPSVTPTITVTSTITPSSPTTEPEGTIADPTKAQVLSTPTLAPTATPSQLDIVVGDITQRVGIDDLTILGLNGKNLINFLISILIVLVGGLLGVFLVNGLIWITKRTPPRVDDRLVSAGEKQLKWLILMISLQFATARLAFLSPELKQWINLIYYALFVFVIASLIWKWIDYGLEEPLMRFVSPQNQDLLVTFAPLLRRSIQVLIFFIALAIVLQNFGVNLSALLAILGLGGLAVSLAAKETLEDMINGFIILIDRPFRIGDRIKIESMDTWGDVEGIGSRTTRIRTLDNRLVIVPNSVIGRSQVENYTYPDPSYRISVSLGIGYGSDIDQVIEIIKQAILDVPEIMISKPPVVDFVEFGDSAMIFRAMYWLKTYNDIGLRTRVNKSISQALDKAKVEMPFITYDVNLAYKEKPAEETN